MKKGIQINELLNLAKFSISLPLPTLSTSLFSTPTAVMIKFSNDPIDEFFKHWGKECS